MKILKCFQCGGEATKDWKYIKGVKKLVWLRNGSGFPICGECACDLHQPYDDSGYDEEEMIKQHYISQYGEY